MTPDVQQDPNHRVRELEGRVAELTRELELLRADRRSSARGRRIGDPLPKPPPPTGRAWTIRAIMVLMALATGAAVAVNYSVRDIDFSDWSTATQRLASVRVSPALMACGACALIALFLYRRLTLGFLFFAVCAVYPAFALYLMRPALTLPISERAYAWTAFGALTAWHTLVSMLCVMESRRIGRGRGRSALIGTINCLAFYPLVWHGLNLYGATNAGPIYACLGGIAVLLAVYAESSGTHRNYLFQIFVAAALVLFNFAMNTILDGAWFLAALAVECLLLAALHHWTGIVVLKSANVAVLIVTFVLTMQAMKFTGPLYVGERALYSNWLQGLFAVGVFLLTAWYYATHIRSVKPQHRRLSGHWFLADTMFDVPSSTVSLLHAAGAALLLTLLMISDLGNLPSLPFMLALSSFALAVIGVALRTPQIEVGAVMLIVASHVSFYFFLYVGKEGFHEQPMFTLYTALLAAYTFVGGYRSERFLARISGGRSSDHHASASIPYVVAIGSTAVLVHRFAGAAYTPLVLAGSALCLAFSGVALRAAGLKLSAVAALAVSAGLWFYALVHPGAAISGAQVWLMAAALIVTCVAVERCFPWRVQSELMRGTIDHLAQVVALLLAGAIGAGTLAIASDGEWRAVLLFAHAFLWIVLCIMVPEPEFRWTTLLLVIGSAAWLAIAQRAANPGASVTVLVACGGVFVAILCAVWFLFPRRHVHDGARLAAGK
ncbi:MAG: hypothetical protein HUU46_05715 [Candidatus Hydrogenedentes bacterium]|nr:hypothetical protein [Candidatus Hydrogenedentota bacterium]